MKARRRPDALLAAALQVIATAGLHVTSVYAGAETEAERRWAFQPVKATAPPHLTHPGNASWVRNEIDQFILAKLEHAGIAPAPEADRATLARRAFLDLTGLPPTPDELDAFVKDPAHDAYGRLVDRLLESKRYGEHWARHWLDIVRYSDSNGFKSDEYRPHIWRYRDWVIQAFNDDMPYNAFVRLQVAGDELAPGDPAALVATGFLRLWPYESNQRNVTRQWDEVLDNMTDITGDVFLGVSVSCAKCHDHKFDPIRQKDYFALRAFFAPFYPDDSLTAADERTKQAYATQLRQWEDTVAPIRAAMEEMKRPIMESKREECVRVFAPEFQEVYYKPESDCTPADLQVRLLMQWQVEKAQQGAMSNLKGDEMKRWKALNEQLGRYDDLRPKSPPTIMAVRDVGVTAPPTTIPGNSAAGEIAPEYLSVLQPVVSAPAVAPLTSKTISSSGRRRALAAWLTRPDHPLTTRVIVNRAWHYMFGRGIVATTNDFGSAGARPTHPELLDWLTRRFVQDGWSLKKLNRLLVTSATYRQASSVDPGPEALALDPGNHLLWRMRVRRLSSEQLRDAILVASGELDPQTGGPGDKEDTLRRSVYQRVMRNTRPDFMVNFDGPDTFNSCAKRDVTTTPTQALFLLNGDWTAARAAVLAKRIASRPDWVDAAFRLCFGRGATTGERAAAEKFVVLQETESAPMEALTDFCHALLNANEFLYLD